MTKRHPLCPRLLACALLMLPACTGSSRPQPQPPSAGDIAAGRARLTVQIVDAPTPKYEEVVVTITRITAHSTVDGWVVISDAPATLDLLKLKDVGFVFGKADLSPGRITQLRLYTDPAGPQYVTLADGSRVDLKVPSGPQSGIKIKAQLDLAACEETTITLDFMPQKSIHVHPTGDGDLWILRPVIKTKGVVASAIGCETPDPGDGDGEPTADPDPGSDPDGDLPTGSPCTQGTECLSEFCDNGSCGPGQDGAPCISGADCASGTCLAASCVPAPAVGRPPGADCTASIECLSGTCDDGTCGLGGPGAPCLSAGDCASATCTDGTCGNGPAVGAGQPCTTGTGCLSGLCTGDVCEAGGQGTPCLVLEDCGFGLTCDAGYCVPVIN